MTFAPSWMEGGWSYWLGGSSGAASIGLYGPTNTLNDGQFHSLVHTFNRDGNAVTYLDGAMVDSRPISNVDNIDSGLPLTIGQDPTGLYGVDGFGNIDDVGIWRRALSPVEAQSIYLVGQNYARSFDTYGPVTLNQRLTSDGMELIWQAGTLEAADNAEGPYNPVVGASAPFYKVTMTGDRKFYRVKL